jgi:hypothetical protein
MMRFAVSILSPPNYIHSEAFREVAETIHFALLALGHDSILTEETNISGRQHIILGSNLLPYYDSPIAEDAILYNLEQISPDSPWLHPNLLDVFRRYRVWDYSQSNIAALHDLGVANVEYLPVGYMPQLTRIPVVEEDIDIVFIGSINERRWAIIEALRSHGVHVEVGFGIYGTARDQLIARAKILLNIHFYEAKVFEAVRVSYLLANHRFVVSEIGNNLAAEEAFDAGVVFSSYEDLVESCLVLLLCPEERQHRAALGFEIMVQRPQTIFLAPLIQKLNLSRS